MISLTSGNTFRDDLTRLEDRVNTASASNNPSGNDVTHLERQYSTLANRFHDLDPELQNDTDLFNLTYLSERIDQLKLAIASRSVTNQTNSPVASSLTNRANSMRNRPASPPPRYTPPAPVLTPSQQTTFNPARFSTSSQTPINPSRVYKLDSLVVIHGQASTPEEHIRNLAICETKAQWEASLQAPDRTRPFFFDEPLEMWNRIPKEVRNEIDGAIYTACNNADSAEVQRTAEPKGENLRRQKGLTHPVIQQALQNYCMKKHISLAVPPQSNASVNNNNTPTNTQPQAAPASSTVTTTTTATSSTQNANLLKDIEEALQCVVLQDVADNAVILVPCGHSLSESSAQQIMAQHIRDRRCPSCRKNIEKHIPNIMARNVVDAYKKYAPQQP